MRSQIKALQAASQDWLPEFHKDAPQTSKNGTPSAPEETLVSDFRAGMTPADFVENKFQRVLRECSTE